LATGLPETGLNFSVSQKNADLWRPAFVKVQEDAYLLSSVPVAPNSRREATVRAARVIGGTLAAAP